jgi:hypothetical protein
MILHIRYYNDQGFPTKLGISLHSGQFQFLVKMRVGVCDGVHFVPLPDKTLLFKENEGYLNGCAVPKNIIDMLPELYPEIVKIMC